MIIMKTKYTIPDETSLLEFALFTKFIIFNKQRQIGHIFIRLSFIIFRPTISCRSESHKLRNTLYKGRKELSNSVKFSSVVVIFYSFLFFFFFGFLINRKETCGSGWQDGSRFNEESVECLTRCIRGSNVKLYQIPSIEQATRQNEASSRKRKRLASYFALDGYCFEDDCL